MFKFRFVFFHQLFCNELCLQWRWRMFLSVGWWLFDVILVRLTWKSSFRGIHQYSPSFLHVSLSDSVYTRKTLTSIERMSSTTVFLETKERLFNTPTNSLLGGYRAKHKQYGDINTRLPLQQGRISVNLQPNASNGNNNSRNSLNGSEKSTDSLPNNNKNTPNNTNNNFPPRVLDSPIFTDYDIETIATLIVSDINSNNATNTTNTANTNTNNTNNTNTSVANARTSRTLSTEKTELKRKWIALTKRASTILSGRNTSGGTGFGRYHRDNRWVKLFSVTFSCWTLVKF